MGDSVIPKNNLRSTTYGDAIKAIGKGWTGIASGAMGLAGLGIGTANIMMQKDTNPRALDARRQQMALNLSKNPDVVVQVTELAETIVDQIGKLEIFHAKDGEAPKPGSTVSVLQNEGLAASAAGTAKQGEIAAPAEAPKPKVK
jgi:hypothetical protein